MRLICPNCGAQYEVPSEAIPPAGRDVQCSACGRTWFEKPPASESEPEPWDLVPRPLDDDEEADDLAETEAAPAPVPPTGPAPAATAPRSTVTPEVAGILRAEAEREAQARAQEAAARAIPLTDRPASASVPKPARPEPPRVVPTPDRQLSRPARPSERGLDIDQINSSLRTANNRIGGKAPQVARARRRGGFASGFWGALLVLAVLAGLYVGGPRIVEAVPQSGVVLNPYVATVNNGRLWLDRKVGVLLGRSATTP